MNDVKERGVASFLCKLENGVISIYHGTDKILLKEWVGGGSDWEMMWKLFEILENASKNEAK